MPVSYFIVVDTSGRIVNRVTIDSNLTWEPPEGLSAFIDTYGMAIGGTYISGTYTPPDAPPATIPTRTKRQINAALILSGLTTDPEAWMDGILANIPDPVARALAFNDRRNAPYYDRSNPLFNDPALLALAGLTVEQVDAMWAAAGELPA